MKNQLRNLVRRIARRIRERDRERGKKRAYFRRPTGPVVFTSPPKGSLEDFLSSELLGMAVAEEWEPEWVDEAHTRYEMVKSGRPTQKTIDRIKGKVAQYLNVQEERVLVSVRFRPPDIDTPYLSISVSDS